MYSNYKPSKNSTSDSIDLMEAASPTQEGYSVQQELRRLKRLMLCCENL